MEEINVNKEDFEYALSNFGKGTIFEEFALSFLSHCLGTEFIPVGGSKDQGIDGSMRLHSRNTHPTFIYQISTDHSYEEKIKNSIEKLISNKIVLDKFIYVTGRKVNQKNKIEDDILSKYKIPITIFDVVWFSTNVVNDDTLVRLYNSFIESNIHQFRKPDKIYITDNYISDPRLFVFMRQHFDFSKSTEEIENKLADTLILYALEGTASETKTFRSLDQIKANVAKYVKFNPKAIDGAIDRQLQVLSSKPRQINFHINENAYCLPYSTRLRLHERDIEEQRIFEAFREQTTSQLKEYLIDEEVKATNLAPLIEETIHKIYYKQGIEFASFIIEGQNSNLLEIALPDVVSEVVDNSHIILSNKEKVKRALLMMIRNMAYNGKGEQKEYLRRLSHTYNMMFMLRWDPHLAGAFQKLASQLRIFVGTSILIPAFSEILLDTKNRRFWSLLKGAHQAGVQLIINETILDELVSHFKMIKYKFKAHYKSVEDFYLESETHVVYIDEILIRAYFYSKSRGKVKSFDHFIESFANPSLNDIHRDLKEFLHDEFHIKFEDTKEVERKIDQVELGYLTEKLSILKNSEEKAATDAKLMLMIYKQRELNSEGDQVSIFGYKTWWLSKDIFTYRAIQDLFKKKYNVNCYMRSDFLFNYIAMAPKKKEVDAMFKEVFPSLLGINLSYHMPKDICNQINKSINEHSLKSPTMIRRAIRGHTERLMTSPTKSSSKMISYFEEELKKLKGKMNS